MSVSEEAPAGMVKVPLDRPARRVVAMVAQLSPLVDSAEHGRERKWCKASADTIAEYLSVGRQHVQDELTAAERAGLLLSAKAGRGRRRRLANPHPARFAIVSKRAIATVGCRWVDGKWKARRNSEFLFSLFCELAHDARTGTHSTQEELAERLGVELRTIERGVETLAGDGWATIRKSGRGNVYTVNAAALIPVPAAPEGPQEVIHRATSPDSTATGHPTARRQVTRQHGDTDIEPDRELDRESVVRPVRAAHVGDAHASATAPPASEDPDSQRDERPGVLKTPRPAAPTASAVLGRLPAWTREDAPPFIRAQMARWIDSRVLADGYGPGALISAADRTAPVDGTHFDRLRAIRTTLRADVLTGEICRDCGGDLFARHGRCPDCDAHAPMSPQELEQLARIHAALGGPGDCETPRPAEQDQAPREALAIVDTAAACWAHVPSADERLALGAKAAEALAAGLAPDEVLGVLAGAEDERAVKLERLDRLQERLGLPPVSTELGVSA